MVTPIGTIVLNSSCEIFPLFSASMKSRPAFKPISNRRFASSCLSAMLAKVVHSNAAHITRPRRAFASSDLAGRIIAIKSA